MRLFHDRKYIANDYNIYIYIHDARTIGVQTIGMRTIGMRIIGMEDNWLLVYGILAWRTIGIDFLNYYGVSYLISLFVYFHT